MKQAKARPKRSKKRGLKPVVPIEQRVYYTRAEACRRYGLSAKRLAEAIANDETLPMMVNGRNQLFPKDAMDDWFVSAARRRRNVRDPSAETSEWRPE